MEKTKVALLGAGFIADIHLESYHRFVPEAEVVAVYTRDRAKAEAFARKHRIRRSFTDLDRAIEESDCEVVDVCLPNFLHDRAVMAAARAEKHSGPHSDWVYDIKQSGGGVLMDMGCHALAWFRWMLGGRPRALSVQAHLQTGLIHKGRTRGEENSLVIVEFDGGTVGVAENSWAKHGGMEDSAEVYGTGGVCYADLFQGNAALTYSEQGYGYAMEKAGSPQVWPFPTSGE